MQAVTRVNVITGFLGVGKTTAIRSLLSSRPVGEKWAVLVNEFGEVGLDGALVAAGQDGDLVVQEVPGGCLCCAAGLPFQVALNRLLARVKPQRLLIEPTGLGHTDDILTTLAGYESAGQLQLGATLTLVDARKCRDARYRDHPVFARQLAAADVVVAHKTDLSGEQDFESLTAFLREQGNSAPVVHCQFGNLGRHLLEAPRRSSLRGTAPMPLLDTGSPEPAPYNADGYRRLHNSAEGFHSVGWSFAPDWEFDHTAVLTLFTGLEVERLKAVVITPEGIIAANLADGVLSLGELDECAETRIEMIARQVTETEAIEKALLAAGRRLGQDVLG